MFKSGGIVAGSCTDIAPITFGSAEMVIPIKKAKKLFYEFNKKKKCYNAKSTMSLKAFRRMLK